MSFLSISLGGVLLHSHEYKTHNYGITLGEFHHLSYESCVRCEFLKNTHYSIYFESHSSLEIVLLHNYTLIPNKDFFTTKPIQLVGRAPPTNLV